jgi:heat shock protein HslJ
LLDTSEPSKKNRWLIAVILLVLLALVAIISYAGLTAAGLLPAGDTPGMPRYIAITRPGPGANLDLTWAVTVEGQAGGLIDEQLVVQALDAAGNVLAQEPASIQALDPNSESAGYWSVDLIINAPPGSQGQINAFLASPADGNHTAEDSIEVGYGESPFSRDLDQIEQHLWKMNTLNGYPLVDDTQATLQFESFRAVGFGGCNNFRTNFERNGKEINFGFVTSTAKECELPVGVMAQESAYFNALEQVTSFKIDAGKLNLVDPGGTTRVVYEAVITGNIFGPVESELPENSTIRVRLRDQSLEGEVVTEQVITDKTLFPINFSIVYNPKQIIEQHLYGIEVQIEDSAGNVLLENRSPVQVITQGKPSLIEIVLEPVQ